MTVPANKNVADATANQATVLDDFIDTLLVGWSGLRLYVDQRRAGQPADSTMETLLSELLRVQCGDNIDPDSIIGQIMHPRST